MSRRRKHRITESEDLNIMPVMNLFLILIPFLLLTAVFAQTAVFDLSLPEEKAAQADSLTQMPDTTAVEKVLIAVVITDEGFYVIVGDSYRKSLPMKQGQYNYPGLESTLREVKVKYPQQKELFVTPEDEILYDHIIQVMDQGLAVGFEDISFSHGIETVE